MPVVGTPLGPTPGVVGYTTTEKLKARIKKIAADFNLEIHADDELVIYDCLVASYNEIKDYLSARGLDSVAISTFSRGEEFELDIAMWFYSVASGWGGKMMDEKNWPSRFDRRKELREIAIYNSYGELLCRENKCIAVGMRLDTVNSDLGIVS